MTSNDFQTQFYIVFIVPENGTKDGSDITYTWKIAMQNHEYWTYIYSLEGVEFIQFKRYVQT